MDKRCKYCGNLSGLNDICSDCFYEGITKKQKKTIKQPSPDKIHMEAWDKAIEQQYLNRGGFCAYCGEACEPFHSKLPQELRDTACEYNGNHPDCGKEHAMKLILKSSETLGNYEIWECQNGGCDWRESI